MITTNSNLGILLCASVAASATVTQLPYDTNPVNNPYDIGSFNVKKEISEWDRTNMTTFSQSDLPYAERQKLDTVLDFAQKLISDSTDIDSEFVEIVNEHFWDLI
jgi:hypothetical protein